MLQLVVSIAVLAGAPLLYALVCRYRSALAVLDGFAFASIAGLVALIILPECVTHSGALALLGALAGFAVPTFFERALSHAAARTHAVTLLIATFGLALHAFFDGIALRVDQQVEHGHHTLALAVILHRVPVALSVWWLLAPRRGAGTASAALAVIAAGTVGGYCFGDSTVISARLMIIQAVVAGSLLHVVIHRPHTAESPRLGGWSFYEGLGALAGLTLVVALPFLHGGHGGHGHGHGHGHDLLHSPVATAFVQLAAESAPALLLAYVGASLLHGFMPRASVDWIARGGSLSRALRGMAFGLPLPICSCGVVPLYRTLALRGVPAAAGLAFLVATPEIGVDAVLLSLPLLGGAMTGARVVAAALVALSVGWLLGRRASRPEGGTAAAQIDEVPVTGGFGARARAGLRMGLGELVDSTAPWILLGLAVAALISPNLDLAWLAALPGGVDVVIFACAGLPLYVCAAGATPLVATLVARGVSPGAGLALLLTGPATNVTTYGVVSDLHGSRLALRFGAAVAIAAIAAGYLTNLILPQAQVFVPAADHAHVGALRGVALAAFGLLLVSSLLRQGIRRFVGVIFSQAGETCHESCCAGEATSAPRSCCAGEPVAAPRSCCGRGHDREHPRAPRRE